MRTITIERSEWTLGCSVTQKRFPILSAMFKLTSIFLRTLLVMASSAIASATTLVTNGSFEDNLGSGGVGAVTSLNNWATTGTVSIFTSSSAAGSIFGADGGVNNGFATSPDGGFFVMIGSTSSTVSQTIGGLNPGDIYSLTFYWAAAEATNQTGPVAPGVTASLGSDSNYGSPDFLPFEGFGGWQSYSHSFTAASTSETLALGADGASGVILVDGVALTDTSAGDAPEPGSVVLVATALGGLALLRRR